MQTPRLTKSERRFMLLLARGCYARKTFNQLTFNNWCMTRKLRKNRLIEFDEHGVIKIISKALFIINVGFI